METQNKRRCESCNVDVNKSSYAKHLRSKMHEDNERLITSNFFNEFTSKETKNKVKQKLKTTTKEYQF